MRRVDSSLSDASGYDSDVNEHEHDDTHEHLFPAKQRTARGETPLHFACERGNVAMVKFCINEGKADVDASTTDNVTPLLAAAGAGCEEVCRFLLEKGANVWATANLEGESKGILQFALESGNEPLVTWLANKPLERKVTEPRALICAAEANMLSVVKLLMKCGASPTAMVSHRGITQHALHAAAQRGGLDVVQFLVRSVEGTALTQLLDTPTSANRTALDLAVLYRNVEVAKYLICRKADMSLRSGQFEGEVETHVGAHRQGLFFFFFFF